MYKYIYMPNHNLIYLKYLQLYSCISKGGKIKQTNMKEYKHETRQIK